MVGKKRIMAIGMAALLAMVSGNSITAWAGESEAITIEGGQVQGVPSDTDGVQVFKGIPYAADTSGENRWKAPQDAEKWEGIKVCDTWGDQSMQKSSQELNPVGGFWGDEFYFDDSYNPPISENGLNLNVYTPAKTQEDKLPVLVYIHGGGNNHGNASEMEFNAAKLAEKGIVVVSVQYRLGMYGFLTLPGLSEENDQGASGNYAVLDLIKALQWVQKNIEEFGGNPDQVTISGQSAGAMNVTALLRSPLAKGLFQNAIIQSGFAGLLSPAGEPIYQDMEDVQETAEDTIKKAMGLPDEITSEELVKELRSHDAQYYMETKSVEDDTLTLYDTITRASSKYVIDDYVFTEESVDLSREGALDGINIMMGGTSDEQTSLSGDPEGTMTQEEFASSMEAAYGEGYEKAYAAESDQEAYRTYLRSISDSCFAKYLVSAEEVSKNSDTDIYVYYFNQKLPPHKNVDRDEDFYGSFHSSELWYTFNSMRDVEGQRQWTEEDYALADQISSYVANFVKTGDPNGEGLATWEPCTEESSDSFMWWHEGQSESATNTDYPERNQFQKEVAKRELGVANKETEAPEFSQTGDTWEYGHFTVKAIALNANSEEINENPDFTVYEIDDYTKEVPMADSYDANGATVDNNTASMYMIVTDEKALLIDMGNGAAATAMHFGEDTENQDVLKGLEVEYKEVINTLAGDRELEIAVTHNHGDHLGYYNALAGNNLKLYFPEGDYTEDITKKYGDFSQMYNLELFTPGEFEIVLNENLSLNTISCPGHTNASTIYVLDVPVVTYQTDKNGEYTDSSANYLVFSGDALGSGSSGWIFSAEGLKELMDSIEPVYEKLASYNSYKDYLGKEEKEAGILIKGGHSWQTTNRFGEMSMDLSYVNSMKELCEKIKEGKWVKDGEEGKSIDELLKEGKLVTKPLEHPLLDTTIYYGEEPSSIAAITTSEEILKEVATSFEK